MNTTATAGAGQSRFIPLSEEQLLRCSYDALAIIELGENAAWTLQNSDGANEDLAGSIVQSLRLLKELLAPIHDALAIMHRPTHTQL